MYLLQQYNSKNGNLDVIWRITSFIWRHYWGAGFSGQKCNFFRYYELLIQLSTFTKPLELNWSEVGWIQKMLNIFEQRKLKRIRDEDIFHSCQLHWILCENDTDFKVQFDKSGKIPIHAYIQNPKLYRYQSWLYQQSLWLRTI